MDGDVELAMFPLGSVLFPAMPLALRVFEDRYLAMVQDLLAAEPAEFGVVLIERGQEVGGGEQRFSTGTVARVTKVTAGDGYVGVLARGFERIEILEWLAETPYPRAKVRTLPELVWDETCGGRREQAEDLVRRTLARASEFDDQQWSPDVELVDDPVASLWQLAAIAPVGLLDKVGLLRSDTARTLLDRIFTATQDAGEVLDARAGF